MPDPATPDVPNRRTDLGAVEALAAGTRLGEFELLRVLGSGGFGIVYLALDRSLGRHVAIKEYLPAALAGRGSDGQVSVRSTSFADSFEAGLRSFVNEARLLARFDHPALVKVYRFWEANGTAYMVMPYYEGRTLKQARASMGGPPDPAWARATLDALLGALDVLHAASVFHRDVAPDNILLLPSGQAVLLDFGAARHVIAGQTQTLTAMLKPAYAPIEQYADASEFRQGPWTDIYAAAATLHFSLLGKPPPTAARRAVQDSYEPLAGHAALLDGTQGPAHDAAWLAAIDWALAVKPHDRPQSIAPWRAALARRSAVPRRTAMPSAEAASTPAAVPDIAFEATRLEPRAPTPPKPRRARWGMAAVAAALLAAVVTAFLSTQHADSTEHAAVTALQVSTPPAPPRAEPEPAPAPVPTPPTVATSAAPSAVEPPAAAMPAADADNAAAATGDPAPPAAEAPPRAPVRRPVAKAPRQREPRRPLPATEPAAPEPPPAQARADDAARESPAAAAPSPTPVTPRQACGKRVLVALWKCMSEVCGKPSWQQHAQCVKWRQLEARNRRDLG